MSGLECDNVVAAAEARTKGYLPRILAAYEVIKSTQEVETVVEDAEVYRGKVRDANSAAYDSAMSSFYADAARYSAAHSMSLQVYRPRAHPETVVLVATGRQSAFDRAIATIPYVAAAHANCYRLTLVRGNVKGEIALPTPRSSRETRRRAPKGGAQVQRRRAEPALRVVVRAQHRAHAASLEGET